VPLEVPPDLTQLPGQSRYSVPATVTASGYQAGQAATAGATKTTVPNTIADVHYMRNGDERWLQVDRPPKGLALVRDFWLDNGFLIAVDNPTTGILETDWAENRAKIPQDIIRNTWARCSTRSTPPASATSSASAWSATPRAAPTSTSPTAAWRSTTPPAATAPCGSRARATRPGRRVPAPPDGGPGRDARAVQGRAGQRPAAAAATGPQARLVSQDGAPPSRSATTSTAPGAASA
jgi:hypothetical protein